MIPEEKKGEGVSRECSRTGEAYLPYLATSFLAACRWEGEKSIWRQKLLLATPATDGEKEAFTLRESSHPSEWRRQRSGAFTSLQKRMRTRHPPHSHPRDCAKTGDEDEPRGRHVPLGGSSSVCVLPIASTRRERRRCARPLHVCSPSSRRCRPTRGTRESFTRSLECLRSSSFKGAEMRR